MKVDLKALAMMAASVLAFEETDNYENASYYNPGGIGDAVKEGPEAAIQALYYNYVYGEYYG